MHIYLIYTFGECHYAGCCYAECRVVFQNTYQSSLSKGVSETRLEIPSTTGLESAVRQLTIFVFICKTD